jgi:crotonobetainyl-CoA:carnitine CoA-transferase CaiB-like acyl-CoA transferase
VKPETTEDGFCVIPEHPSTGIYAGPLFGALGVLAGIIRARATGEGSYLEIAQSDAAASMDWLRSETYKAYERPEDEVTGNPSDNFERRAPGTAGMRDGVRYQFYETKDDRHVLFMASEQEFWKNFCDAVDRPDLFEKWPGSQYGDHAKGNRELQAILKEIFLTKTAAEWLDFGDRVNTPIAAVNTPQTIAEDPQFQDRLPWLPADVLGCEQLPSPVKFIGEDNPIPTKAPSAGQHNDHILADVLGYDAAHIAALRDAGALG